MERRKFTREFKLEAVRLIKDRGVSYVQASQDLNVHVSQLRNWVKAFADDPQHAFPGNGQMKAERLGIRIESRVHCRRYFQVARLTATRSLDKVDSARSCAGAGAIPRSSDSKFDQTRVERI